MPGVYSKNSFASTTVTRKCFFKSRAEKLPEKAPPIMSTRRFGWPPVMLPTEIGGEKEAVTVREWEARGNAFAPRLQEPSL